jgi:hypothetical protein
VVAFGLLHHLEDVEVEELLNKINKAMKPNGRLFTFDGCFVERQSSIAKFILTKDRGQNIRTKEAYEALTKKHFINVKTSITHNMLRIPYTHIIMECSK